MCEKGNFKSGTVRVVAIPKIIFAPGVKNELGTRKLFKRMLGRGYTVKGFDRHGGIELRPSRADMVWIEPEFLKLPAQRPKTRR
jgi:hypothetical protein